MTFLRASAGWCLGICVLFSAAAQAQSGEPTASLQIIHASVEPSLNKVDIFIQDSYPASALNPPIGSVAYGKSSGFLKVPAGKHKLIVCRAKSGGGCVDKTYELEPRGWGTIVLAGLRGPPGREDDSSLVLAPQWGPQVSELEAQRRLPSRTGRRVTLFNGIEESQPLEMCLAAKAPEKPVSIFAEKKRPFKGEALTSFGQWAGLGELVDQDADSVYATFVEVPKGRVPVHLRVVGDSPCSGPIFLQTGLEKPDEGMVLLVAVGDAESDQLPRELLACSMPKAPAKTECFRHRLRSPAEPQTK